MLNFTDLSLRRGPRLLLEGLSVTVQAGWRVGVVGRNGTGKSSLFALILGDLAPDRGEVALPRGIDIATVAQETAASERSALDHVLDGDAELRALQAQAERAEHEHDAHGLAAAHERLHVIGGYAAPARAARLLRGLAFSDADLQRPLASFSGGWRMRLNLARALMQRSDLLLLDEPTNHLDIDAVLWLQDWLRDYAGTMLVISHDREFLDAVSDHTLHLAQQRGTLYSGNFSAFERLRAERIAQQGAVAEQQRRRIAHLQRFVDRFRASATKAKQAQARVKMIERIQIEAPLLAESEFSFEFPTPARLPSPLLKLDQAAAGYAVDGRPLTILSALSLNLQPGDRIGLLGANGAGKSTFIRLLAGELSPQAGEVVRHGDLIVGYFAQHQLEQLDPAASAMEHFKRLDPGAGEQTLRNYLGGFNFAGERVFEPVAPFSGGEKARLALAMVVYRKPNLLLLDEPTNHLDLDLRQALELALQEFPGALLLVSHDRHLVESTCDVLWRVAEGGVQPFDGDLDDYARWLAAERRAPGRSEAVDPTDAAAPRVSAKDQRRAAADERARVKPLRDAQRRAELQIERCGIRLAQIEQLMADSALYEPAQKAQLAELLAEQGRLRGELEAAEVNWLEASEALEASEC